MRGAPFQPFAPAGRGTCVFFGDCDEISLENIGFPLAFCAISLYNERKNDYGGVCAWVS